MLLICGFASMTIIIIHTHNIPSTQSSLFMVISQAQMLIACKYDNFDYISWFKCLVLHKNAIILNKRQHRIRQFWRQAGHWSFDKTYQRRLTMTAFHFLTICNCYKVDSTYWNSSNLINRVQRIQSLFLGLSCQNMFLSQPLSKTY